MSKAPPCHDWLDFRTGEIVTRPAPATDEEARAYIPQDVETQARYAALRDQGETPVNAIRAIVTQALESWRPARPYRQSADEVRRAA